MSDVDFSQYVVSLARGVLAGLGELPDPETNQSVKNLILAQHSFAVLKMLAHKTEGNLTSDEHHLIQTLIQDLEQRMNTQSK